jgi:uncharacterized protein with HEPN domain
MSRRDKQRLDDLVEATRRITSYIRGLTYEQFLEDSKTQDAVIRNLQVIGEAAKKLSQPLRKAHPHVPWKEMAGMRDRIVHEYFGIKLDIVWVVVSQELPAVLREIERSEPSREYEEPT